MNDQTPQTGEKAQDQRDPRSCPTCGEMCHYDGWGLVHESGIGIGSCAALRPGRAES